MLQGRANGHLLQIWVEWESERGICDEIQWNGRFARVDPGIGASMANDATNVEDS